MYRVPIYNLINYIDTRYIYIRHKKGKEVIYVKTFNPAHVLYSVES